MLGLISEFISDKSSFFPENNRYICSLEYNLQVSRCDPLPSPPEAETYFQAFWTCIMEDTMLIQELV